MHQIHWTRICEYEAAESAANFTPILYRLVKYAHHDRFRGLPISGIPEFSYALHVGTFIAPRNI